MGGSRSEEFLTPTRDRRGHLRAVARAGTPRTSRPSPRSPPSRSRSTTRRAAHVEDTPDTPTIETLVALANAARPPARPAVDGRRHPEERRPRAASRRPASASCSSSGLPGDREVDLKRLEAGVAPAEVETGDRGRLRRAPRARQGLHRPRRARREPRRRRRRRAGRHPVPARPAGRGRHPLDHRRERVRSARVRPRRGPGLRGRADARNRSRPPRSARATPRRTARARSSSPAASRSATSSRSAASTPRRSGLTVLDRNGKSVVVTMGSYGIGVTRVMAALAEANHDDAGPRLARARRAGARARRRHRQGPGGVRGGRVDRRPSCPRAAPRSCTTTGPRSRPA